MKTWICTGHCFMKSPLSIKIPELLHPKLWKVIKIKKPHWCRVIHRPAICLSSVLFHIWSFQKAGHTLLWNKSLLCAVLWANFATLENLYIYAKKDKHTFSASLLAAWSVTKRRVGNHSWDKQAIYGKLCTTFSFLPKFGGFVGQSDGQMVLRLDWFDSGEWQYLPSTEDLL